MPLRYAGIVPAPDVYISYKVGAEYRSAPVLLLGLVAGSGQADDDVVPLVWDVSAGKWADGRKIAGFLAVVRTKMLEAHYQASDADMRAALMGQSTLSTEEQIKLIEQHTAVLLAQMIASKRVRNVLASRLPQP